MGKKAAGGPPSSGGAAGAAAAAAKKKKAAKEPTFLSYVSFYGPYALIGLLLVSALSFFLTPSPTSAVTELTDDSFANFLQANPDGALVDFFTPGCPHCEKLAPEFEAAAKELKAKGGAPFAKMDAKAQPKAARKLGIDRYPTVIWFRRGERILELPPQSRTQAKIVEYVEWAGQPALVEFETEAEFEDALPELRKALPATAAPMVVGFAAWEGAHAAVELMAERFRGKHVFMFVKQASASGALLRAFSSDAGRDQEYREKPEQAAMESWVTKSAKPSS